MSYGCAMREGLLREKEGFSLNKNMIFKFLADSLGINKFFYVLKHIKNTLKTVLF